MPVLPLNWLLYAENRLAPLRRKRAGSYMPKIGRLLYAENWVAPLRRKMTLKAMIYARKPLHRFPRHSRKHFPHDSIDVVTAKIAAQHPGIAHLFYSGVGLRAMWIESEVLLDVLIHSMQEGVVALPIHDAVLVKNTAVDAVRSIMLTSFKRITGVQASVSTSLEE